MMCCTYMALSCSHSRHIMAACEAGGGYCAGYCLIGIAERSHNVIRIRPTPPQLTVDCPIVCSWVLLLSDTTTQPMTNDK